MQFVKHTHGFGLNPQPPPPMFLVFSLLCAKVSSQETTIFQQMSATNHMETILNRVAQIQIFFFIYSYNTHIYMSRAGRVASLSLHQCYYFKVKEISPRDLCPRTCTLCYAIRHSLTCSSTSNTLISDIPTE